MKLEQITRMSGDVDTDIKNIWRFLYQHIEKLNLVLDEIDRTEVMKNDNQENESDFEIPIDHSSKTEQYGKGTSSLYGHLKLTDSTTSSLTADSGGTAATPLAVKTVCDLFDGAKIITGKSEIPYGSEKTSVTVEFGYTFQEKPFVIAMQGFDLIPVVCNYEGSVTTTGCTFILSGGLSSSGKREFKWLAIGK